MGLFSRKDRLSTESTKNRPEQIIGFSVSVLDPSAVVDANGAWALMPRIFLENIIAVSTFDSIFLGNIIAVSTLDSIDLVQLRTISSTS